MKIKTSYKINKNHERNIECVGTIILQLSSQYNNNKFNKVHNFFIQTYI